MFNILFCSPKRHFFMFLLVKLCIKVGCLNSKGKTVAYESGRTVSVERNRRTAKSVLCFTLGGGEQTEL